MGVYFGYFEINYFNVGCWKKKEVKDVIKIFGLSN